MSECLERNKERSPLPLPPSETLVSVKETLVEKKNCRKLAILAILHLCLLRYSPQHKSCRLCRQLLYVTVFVLFFHNFILKFKICFYLFLLFFSVFFAAVYLVHPSILFYSSFYSLFYSVLFCFLISFVFFSNLLSFLFSFPITPFCLILPYVLLLFNLFSFCYFSSF